MRVLIIGGTGLISTAITRQLLEAGHTVTLFNRGKSESRLPPGAEVIHGDRTDYAQFEKTFADKTYDTVVDMVAFRPEDCASAVRAFAGRVGQFLHCSTVSVVSGPVTQIPIPETEPFHSIGEYGKNKILCEQLLFREHESSSFPITIMRPSHSYGEGGAVLRAFGPWDTFVDRLRKRKPIIVHGDGSGVFSSCHVDDVARAFIGTMGNPKCLGEAYFIAGDELLSWDMYHQQVAEVVGGEFYPVYIPADILYSVAPSWGSLAYDSLSYPGFFDIAKIKRDTDYSGQTIPLKEGVRRMVAWLESHNLLADSDGDDYEDRLCAAWPEVSARLPQQT